LIKCEKGHLLSYVEITNAFCPTKTAKLAHRFLSWVFSFLPNRIYTFHSENQ